MLEFLVYFGVKHGRLGDMDNRCCIEVESTTAHTCDKGQNDLLVKIHAAELGKASICHVHLVLGVLPQHVLELKKLNLDIFQAFDFIPDELSILIWKDPNEYAFVFESIGPHFRTDFR